MIVKTFIRLLLLCTLSLSAVQAQITNAGELPLIPSPVKLELKSGTFILDKETKLVVADPARWGDVIVYLQSLIREVTEKKPPVLKKSTGNVIEIKHTTQFRNAEAYCLDITPGRIIISAEEGHGVFNAIQTLRQLLPVNASSKTTFPALIIEDYPAFSWRGMHLDVSRHFFSMDYLRKHIDRLAFYKFNKLHLHLTDDQGWRIEIKKYPKLTEEGAWRTFNQHDSVCMKKAKENPNFALDPRFIRQKNGKTMYGGFYTQQEIKDLIRYAQARCIEIIPEIDMPGHMTAAIHAYPFLVEGKAGWGEVFSTPVCPCKEEVYSFIQDVLTEVIDLFPSGYIHIGADEVDKKSWNTELCKEFMTKNKIENVNKLQSYFVHRVQEYIESKGKKIIAWDEILEGGTNPGVTVMYWRGWVKDAPRRAIENGNKVIIAPTNPLYFDYANNNTSIGSVYFMDVIPAGTPPEKANLIQGAQANLWAENIPSEQQADFQMYPRMLALAERVWTNDTGRFESFSKRLLVHYSKLDYLGVNYRLPDIECFTQENVYVDRTDFFTKSPLPGMMIRYTLDGSIPTTGSSVLFAPVTISEPVLLKMALFTANGVRGEIYNLNFRPVEFKKAVHADRTNTGLNCDFYDKSFKSTKVIQGTPDVTFITSNIRSPKETKAFGLKFSGYIDIPETGIYSFFFTCDDGGVLYIDGKVVVDNDGQHSPVLKSGQAALEKGLHPFRLDFIEAGGGFTLKLQYSFDGSPVRDVPDAWFKHGQNNIH